MKGIQSLKLNLAIIAALGLAVAQPTSAANTAPTINTFRLNNQSSNITINEGQSVTASFTATDSNGDQMRFCWRNVTTNALLCGGYVAPNTAKVGSFSTPLLFSDNGSFTYRAQAQDIIGATSTNSITRTITVNNVAPTLTGFNLSSNTIYEGQSASISFSATDPGADAISFLLNGNNIGTNSNTSGTRSLTYNLGTFADNGTVIYTGQARDDDGGSSSVSRPQTLNILNVAPTLVKFDLSSYEIFEGQSVSAIFQAIDPGADAIAFFLNGSSVGTILRLQAIAFLTST
jgi:hypothetical protein